MPNLNLYYLETCPYCRKVLHFMDENGIQLGMKNASAHPELRAELSAKGGRSQFPALEIDGEIMYESDDIIVWLKENYSQ
ncbi:MAG: glutathione S-transferase N-terminal domain-containing protein [Candidatus Omnitrophica bacterium]|nr:glutathione S-transferase N-terminal domain-containing protein [Candidatus Omnitrophota bacterium]MCA9403466.1 glutathione S-transferase N-terminal domain-containing protein [Candidatus Omnitrophota bacterium]MCB9722054.1 glutathione S-transferase N-terminal domain-containing protein [Candidatus Omnitrophota bacterium]